MGITVTRGVTGSPEVASGGTVDGVTVDSLSTPTSPSQNGFVVKAPDAAWDGDVEGYGKAQAFMLLREDAGGVEPTDNVLFRVDGHDAHMGTGGILHVATGLRQRPGYTADSNTSVFITPSVPCVGIVVKHHSNTPEQDYIHLTLNDGTQRLVYDKDAILNLYRNAAGNNVLLTKLNSDTQPRFQIAVSGLLGWGAGGTNAVDTSLLREAAGILQTQKIHLTGEIEIDGALNHDGTTVGFYGTAPVTKQTGVAVTAAGVHAALVNLGLIAA